jgi:hypothetical protein
MADDPKASVRKPRRGWRRVLMVVLATVVVLFLFIRFALSPIITAVVNRKLSEIPGYTGHVESVNLALWRGTVDIDDFILETRKSPGDGPVADVRHMMVSFAWRPLLRGKFGGHAVIEDAEFTVYNDVAIPEEAKSEGQKHEERGGKAEEIGEWQKSLREAFPMELNRFELRNARLRYVDRTVEPHPEVILKQVAIVATGLRNRHEPRDQATDNLPARVMFNGVVDSGGSITVDIRADPIADLPRFKVNMEVLGLQLTPLNGFVRAYAQSVVESGRFEVFIEVNAEGGTYQGYVKPFFEELEFRAEKDEGLVKRAVTAVASATAEVLDNEKEKTATVVPIQGNFTDNQIDVWETVRNLLRNAFVQALREGFGGRPEDSK